MSVQKLNPYLLFNGHGAEAIRLYETALGTKVEHRMGYGDVPNAKDPAKFGDLIIHALLRVGTETLMLSDAHPDQPPVQVGNNVQVALHFEDPAAMEKAFQALSAGGKVTQPIQDAFCGAKFGMLTDAFGIGWMFDCPIKKG
jgi:PhnB protein